MQAALILGMFGALFFVTSSITTILTQSTQQIKQRQLERVDNMFDDVATVLNEVVLKQTFSLANQSMDNLSFLSTDISWTEGQLTTDPWGSEYGVGHFTQPVQIAAYGPGLGASADVDYFTLISPGPNRRYETSMSGVETSTTEPPLPSDYNDWRDLRANGAKGDDILTMFSTQDALGDVWNRATTVTDRITGLLQSSYNQQVEGFLQGGNLELFDDFYSCVARDQTTCESFDPDILDACISLSRGDVDTLTWSEVLGTTPPDGLIDYDPEVTVSNCWMLEPEFQDEDNYPSMAGRLRESTCSDSCNVNPLQLGFGEILSQDPFGGAITLAYDNDYPSMVRVGRSIDRDGWAITTETIVDGDVGVINE